MDNMTSVTAAVLAGGLGTRLRAAVSDRPKVMAEVNERPFLCHILGQLERAGVRKTVLCTGYMAEMVEALGESHGAMTLAYSREDAPLGTAGALRLALPRLDTPLVLALNGDSICPVDLRAFLAWHLEKGGRASIVLSRQDDTSRYGLVETSADGVVTAFREKQESHGPGWVNAGIYLLGRDVLEAIPTDRPTSMEREVFPQLPPGTLYGFPSGSPLLDIGTPDSYAMASAFLRTQG